MNKYVIELRPDCKVVQQICESDGQVSIGAKSIEYFEELNSDYINEHFGDLQDEAYKRGINDGSLDVKQRVEGAYQKGFEDGKAQSERGCEGCKYSGTPQGDSPCFNCSNYYKNNWTAKDDKIEVGDEVKRKTAPKNERGGIVTKEWEDIYYIMWTDGSSGQWDKDRVVKTGRHFDIASILEEMRHD